MIPPEFIQQLLSRIDIVEIVGAHVELKKAGANLKGLCPFHGEKTPSFNVSPVRQTYHCFGCGAHGDALKFLLEYQGLGFIDAIQDLARRAGMEVPNDTRTAAQREKAAQAKAQRKGLSELLAQAAGHYANCLRQHAHAVEYLKGRGLSGRVAADFGIGYAPAGWRELARCFPNYDAPELVEAGLVVQAEPTGENSSEKRRYDRFRDRIMFPIRNVSGDVIGFGGRVLGHGEPKYLNSPETPVFNKGTELYGLFEGRAAIRQRGYALVVEGYMDVVALAQHGLCHAVASLGTACTAEHVAKLFRFTEHIVFSFDGDAAGQRAAARVLPAVLPHLTERRGARFVFLPPEHDPDSFVRAFGADAFETLVEQAQPLSAHLLAVAGEGCRLDTPEGRARLLAQARPLWQLLPDGLLRRQLLGEFARLARLPEPELAQLWSTGGGSGVVHATAQPMARQPAPRTPPPRVGRRVLSAQDRVLRLLLVHAAWWDQLSAQEHDKLLTLDTPHAGLLAWLDRTVAEHGPLHWASLRPLLLSDASARELLDALEHVRLQDLDFEATLDSPLEDLRAQMAKVAAPDVSPVLGRSAPSLRRTPD